MPPRSTPYHIKDRAAQAIAEMIKQYVIEEHPTHEPASWISNAVIAPKALRELTKSRSRFKWNQQHQQCFTDLLASFRKDALLR
jgi:hypothetical protein